jgi:hypothetical protein
VEHVPAAAIHLIIHDFKEIARSVKAKHDIFVFKALNRTFIPGVGKGAADIFRRDSVLEGRGSGHYT